MFQFQFRKTRPDAVAPCKQHQDDVGYDLTLLELVKEENGVQFFDTGIAVRPPLGYYFEVVGRSSISKSGYTLANNIGVIDPNYRGSIRVALFKHNPDMPQLPTPNRLVQLIPRAFHHFEPKEVDNLNETDRGDGGFGSTGNHA
jgi:dUTP pyrophosphatase